MVQPTKVSLFTPVVEAEDESSLFSLPAIYLSSLFCNKDVAVIIPGSIDAAGNQDCNRKELKTTMAGTVLKIISYFTVILPLLAMLLNLIIRCDTQYQYANAPDLHLPEDPADGFDEQAVQAFLEMGMDNEGLEEMRVSLNAKQQLALNEAILRQTLQNEAPIENPAPQPGVRPEKDPSYEEMLESFLDSGMNTDDLRAVLNSDLNATQQRAVEEAIRRKTGQAQPQPAAPASKAPTPAPQATAATLTPVATMNEEELRVAYRDVLDNYDPKAGGIVCDASDSMLEMIQARAKVLGIDLDELPQVTALKARLKDYEKIKNDAEKLNAAFRKELDEANSDGNNVAIGAARLANIHKLDEYARALEGQPKASTPAPQQPTPSAEEGRKKMTAARMAKFAGGVAGAMQGAMQKTASAAASLATSAVSLVTGIETQPAQPVTALSTLPRVSFRTDNLRMERVDSEDESEPESEVEESESDSEPEDTPRAISQAAPAVVASPQKPKVDFELQKIAALGAMQRAASEAAAKRASAAPAVIASPANVALPQKPKVDFELQKVAALGAWQRGVREAAAKRASAAPAVIASPANVALPQKPKVDFELQKIAALGAMQRAASEAAAKRVSAAPAVIASPANVALPQKPKVGFELQKIAALGAMQRAASEAAAKRVPAATPAQPVTAASSESFATPKKKASAKTTETPEPAKKHMTRRASYEAALGGHITRSRTRK